MLSGSGLPPGYPFRVGVAAGGQPDALLATSKRREQRSVFLFGKLRLFPCFSFPHKGRSPLWGPLCVWEIPPQGLYSYFSFFCPTVGFSADKGLLLRFFQKEAYRGNTALTGAQGTKVPNVSELGFMCHLRHFGHGQSVKNFYRTQTVAAVVMKGQAMLLK